MKHFKKILPVAAFIFAVIGSFAMSSPNYSDPVWKYNGGSETSPNSYTLGNPGCPAGNNICKIVAPEDAANPGRPKIDMQLATRIQNRDVSQGDVFLKQ